MKKLHSIFLALATAMALSVPVLAQDFQAGDLLYEIIGNDPPEVSLFGHVDGQEAQGELDIPETVQFEGVDYTVAEIRQSAFFRCGGLTGNLNIPVTVRAIRQLAFYECVGLTGTLAFPDSMREIEIGAFTNCTGFTGTLSLPNSMMALGDYTGLFPGEYLPDYGTFEGCIGFDRLELPESLEFIGPSCFANCSNLKGQLTIPEGTKIIAENAFEHCTGFTGTLTIPESMVSVRDYAFMGCIGIEDVILPGHDVFYIYYYPSYYTSQQISKGVFKGCEGLSRVEISDGLETLGSNVFENCANLVSVILPESLRVIGGFCFYQCVSLSEINLPQGLKDINNWAFGHCTNLSHVVLPNSLTTLGAAFEYCTGLTGDMVIPDSVSMVITGTFVHCTGLNRIILGSSVNYVFEDAFDDTQLESLVIRAATPPQLIRFFTPNQWHFPEEIQIIVPCGTLETYQNAEGWSEFTNISEGNTFLLYVTPDDENLGTVRMLKEPECGDMDVEVKAEPFEGSEFQWWEIDGETVSTDNPYRFVLEGDTKLVAHFSRNNSLLETALDLSVHPNPASGSVTVTDESLLRVEIHNLLGQLVASSDCDGDSVTIDLQSLSQGVYLVTATDRNGRQHVRKLAVGN